MVDVSDLTLEEKASLTSGLDFWHTKAVERVGVPSVMVTDGPHGLRKQRGAGDHLGLGVAVPATCFPPAVGLGSSWDVDLLYRVGVALGVETSIENVGVILGPGLNIKRSPLCGRNFEYFSEDPLISGVLAAALINGIQSMGVGASAKHFAANNQEDDRMRVSADIDARTLHEIYLRGFERVVEDSAPWTIMCSYNKVNGTYASESRFLLNDVLRDRWGFDGMVVSDWGAVNDRVKALAAGLDLQMPSTGGVSDRELVAAVKDGTLSEEVLDTAVERILELVRKVEEGAGRVEGPLDVDAHHGLARVAAGRSIVLLKNQGSILPLRKDTSIAVIGEFAKKPRYQGAGSSLINPTLVDCAVDEIRTLATGEVTYSQGFSTAVDVSEEETRDLRAKAVSAAKDAEVAVLFLGLPARLEAEGFDREHIDLPADQLDLVDAVLEVNPRTVVVLSNGAVVALPFAESVPAIVEAWLLGQAGGGGTADVLFGVVNPSGKLTETIPHRLADTPSFLNFPGGGGHVLYGEGIYVGYRWYDARDMSVAFPFGHGLSYTTFKYGVATARVVENGDVDVSVTVTNDGSVRGREVVQVYVALPDSGVGRPPRELKAFGVVDLQPGQSKVVNLNVRRKDLAYWDVRRDDWVVEGGTYRLDVGSSSRDIRTSVHVDVEGDPDTRLLTRESSLGEVMAHPLAGPMVQSVMAQFAEEDLGGPVNPDIPEGVSMETMMMSIPIGRLSNMVDAVSAEMIDGLIAVANGQTTL